MPRSLAMRMTPCRLQVLTPNRFDFWGGLSPDARGQPFLLMDAQAIVIAIQELIKSGALAKMDQPGAQTFVIYALLIILAMLSLRLFVINGAVRRFFDLEEHKVYILSQIQGDVVDLKTEARHDHQKLNDVLQMLESKRQSDQT